MVLPGYLALFVAIGWLAVKLRRTKTAAGARPAPVRLLACGGALLLAVVGGIVVAINGVGDRDAESTIWGPWIIGGALLLGAGVFLAGHVVADGSAAEKLRLSGWIAAAGALAYPSTLTLLLPLLALLAATVPSAARAQKSQL